MKNTRMANGLLLRVFFCTLQGGKFSMFYFLCSIVGFGLTAKALLLKKGVQRSLIA